jgi:hypothetical protein
MECGGWAVPTLPGTVAVAWFVRSPFPLPFSSYRLSAAIVQFLAREFPMQEWLRELCAGCARFFFVERLAIEAFCEIPILKFPMQKNAQGACVLSCDEPR